MDKIKSEKRREILWILKGLWGWVEGMIFLVAVIGLGVMLYGMGHPPAVGMVSDTALKITVFSVGQGDAILVESGQGLQMLIDGGPDDIVLSKLGQAMPRNDRTIERLVLTHPDADHITGLVEVLRRYDVEMIMMTGVIHPTGGYLAFQDELRKRAIPIQIVAGPEEFVFGESLVRVLYPFENMEGVYPKNVNDTSIVLRIIQGEHEILLAGDIEIAVEEALAESGQEISSEILKVGHHGSKTSSSKEFFEAVQPDYAVISVGLDNSFGHPHYSILRRLADFGARVFRTDYDGDVKIRSDGETLRVLGTR